MTLTKLYLIHRQRFFLRQTYVSYIELTLEQCVKNRR